MIYLYIFLSIYMLRGPRDTWQVIISIIGSNRYSYVYQHIIDLLLGNNESYITKKTLRSLMIHFQVRYPYMCVLRGHRSPNRSLCLLQVMICLPAHNRYYQVIMSLTLLNNTLRSCTIHFLGMLSIHFLIQQVNFICVNLNA